MEWVRGVEDGLWVKVPTEADIPHGQYCYIPLFWNNATGVLHTKLCPFWDKRDDKPEQLNGYCGYLRQGDWQVRGTSLLWDQVKECGVNTEDLCIHCKIPISLEESFENEGLCNKCWAEIDKNQAELKRRQDGGA